MDFDSYWESALVAVVLLAGCPEYCSNLSFLLYHWNYSYWYSNTLKDWKEVVMFEPPLESVSKGRIDNQTVVIAYSK
jgi:hypothetical protein